MVSPRAPTTNRTRILAHTKMEGPSFMKLHESPRPDRTNEERSNPEIRGGAW